MGNADADNRLALPARRGLPAGSLRAHAGHAAREGQGPVRRREREPERHQRAGHRAAAHRGHAGRRLVVCYLLLRAARWLRGRTNRVLNAGLVAAGVFLVVSLAWLAAAYLGARGDLMDARARGSATVEAVAQVGIAAQDAHADESLTLIDNTGDDGYQADYRPRQKRPRPGTRHAAHRRGDGGRGHPGRPGGGERRSPTRGPGSPRTPSVRSDDDNGKHPGGRRLGPRRATGRRGRGVHAAVGRPVRGDQQRPGGIRLHRALRRRAPTAGLKRSPSRRPCSWPPRAPGA